jgi:outer membrane protein assembly factor BamB
MEVRSMTQVTRFLLLSVLASLALESQVSVLMSRYDTCTTAANTRETILTAANVNPSTFGRVFTYYVDGAVYAQPLYVPSVRITGKGTRNAIYIATMNDKVYAFDADLAGPPLWMRDFTDELAGITPVPVIDITNRNDLNVVGNAGILGTPVIDPAAHAIFAVVRTKENGIYVQRLRKLDLASGKDLTTAVTIEAAARSPNKDAVNGMLHFDPKAGNQRPALSLVNGNIIIAWASHEDIRPYHGWVMAYDAATLKQTGVFCVDPVGTMGGIWQSGRGPAVDASGAFYFETGNGDWDGEQDFGTSVIKMRMRDHKLVVEDYFTPHDYKALNDRDADLGSTGPLLVPGTHILICGNKKGILYLLDTEKLGHMTPDDAGVLQALPVNGGRALAGPAYWDGPGGGILYTWFEADFLKGFRFNGQTLETAAFAHSQESSHGSPGGALTVSSNGKQPGSGIVWATLTTSGSADHGNRPGVLRALNAETLEELWNSEMQPKRDRLGTLVKFVPPTVVNGRVYIPNYDNAVNVYGMLK